MNPSRQFPALRRLALVAGLAMSPLAAAPAAAADRLLLFGGEVAEAAYYTYAGTLLPFGERHEGRGWYQRYWVDAFGYEYVGGPGRVQADAYGLEGALGYGGSNEQGWWSVSLGLRYTDTSLDPDDPDASARGSQVGGKFQVDFERRLGDDWRFGGIASYSNEQNGYWVRARATHGTARAFGVEAVASGNDEADATAVGLLSTFQPTGSRWTVGVKAGYRFQDDADGVYAGLEFGRAF